MISSFSLQRLAHKIFVPRKMLWCITLALLPAVAFYGLSIYVLTDIGFNTTEILRDPAQQTGDSSFRGFVSNIGVWMWVGATSIALFSAFYLSDQRQEVVLLMGMLSLLLAIDDFFLIHDRYVNERICYLVYFMIAALLILRNFWTLVDSQGFAFALAGSLLTGSVLTDLATARFTWGYERVQLLEEGLKFAGGVVWLYTTVRITSDFLRIKLTKNPT